VLPVASGSLTEARASVANTQWEKEKEMKLVHVRKMKEGNNVIVIGNDNNTTHIEKELDSKSVSEDTLSPTFEVDAMKDAEKALRLVKKQVINDFRLKVKEINRMLFKVKKMKKILRLMGKGDYEGTYRIAEQLHDKNIAIGSFVLAVMYHHGFYVGVDHYTEVLYLEKAAALGYQPAIFDLAIAHAADTWIELDTVKSMQMMSALANGGYEPAVEMMKGLDEFAASETDISSRYAQRAMLRFMA